MQINIIKKSFVVLTKEYGLSSWIEVKDRFFVYLHTYKKEITETKRNNHTFYKILFFISKIIRITKKEAVHTCIFVLSPAADNN